MNKILINGPTNYKNVPEAGARTVINYYVRYRVIQLLVIGKESSFTKLVAIFHYKSLINYVSVS